MTSLADRTKEKPIQSTFWSKATTKSALSFSVKLEILILVSGRLSPFFENNNPPAITFVLTVSFKLVSTTSRWILPSSSKTFSPFLTSFGIRSMKIWAAKG